MHFTQWGLWKFHGQVLTLKRVVSLGSCNMGDDQFLEEKWAWNAWWNLNSIWREEWVGKYHLLSLEKDLWPIKFTWKLAKCLCDSVRAQNSIVEHLHKFLGQHVQTTMGSPPCNWSMWNVLWFYYIYAENSLIIEEHPKLKLKGWCEHEDRRTRT